MRKVFLLIIALVSIIALGMVMVSCSTSTSSSSSATTTTTTSTTTTTGATLTLTVNLSSGSISGRKILDVYEAAEGVRVVALNMDTGEPVEGVTNTNGLTDLTVTSGTSVGLAILNSSGNFIASTNMGTLSATTAATSIIPTGDVTVDVVVDLTSLYAVATPDADLLDEGNPALTSDGNLLGSGSDGSRGDGDDTLLTTTGMTTRDGQDMDWDGVYDIFDSDSDGDGFANAWEENPPSPCEYSTNVERIDFSSNIWAAHGSTNDYYDEIGMRFYVDIVTSEVTTFTGTIGAPSAIVNTAKIHNASSFADPIGYPAEQTLLADEGWQLYSDGVSRLSVLLKPHASLAEGDTFTLYITCDGATEIFYLTLSDFITDWPKVTEIDGTTLRGIISMTGTESGTRFDPITITTTEPEFVFSTALGLNGNPASPESASYMIEWDVYASAESGSDDLITDFDSIILDFDGTQTTISHTLTEETIAAAISTQEVKYYLAPVIDITSGSSTMRFGEEVWFRYVAP